MGFLDNVSKYFNLKTTSKGLNQMDTKRPLLHQLGLNYVSRSKMEVATWKAAIDYARQPVMPNRLELLNIFRESLFDAELKTAIRNALIDIKAAPFLILDDNDNEDKQAKKYFQKSWFPEYLTAAFDVELYGYNLLEFDPKKDDKGEFRKMWNIPHEHYSPKKEQVLFYPTDFEGRPVSELQELGALLLPMCSDASDLGLLSIASLCVIRKGYTLTDWSIHNEKLGKPFIWLQTGSRDKKELDRREQFLAQFADNNYGIGDLEEKFNFLEPSNAGERYKAFLDLIHYQDTSIEKLINGQTGTSNEKAHVGSAEVHERVMGQYTKSRLTAIQYFINEQLLPFLIANGYKLDGKKFQFVEIWEDAPKPTPAAPIEPTEPIAPIDPTKPTPPEPKKVKGEKKKLSSRIAAEYSKLKCCVDLPTPSGNYNNFPSVGRSDAFRPFQLSTVSNIFDDAIKNVFDGKIKKGELSKDVWQYNTGELWKGVTLGFGSEYKDREETDLVKNLRRNVHVFAAFKNHQNMKEITAALVDANGQPRSFDDFKREALKISKNYNAAWLETEYQLAQRSASMALEWEKAQANKDILPNLKYLTVGDDRVREAHKKIDETCLPIDDPWWDLFFPPNGYGCRCYTEQTDAEIKQPDYTPDEKEVPLSMRHNVGKEQKVFSDDHPFFDVSKRTSKSVMEQLKAFLEDLGEAFL